MTIASISAIQTLLPFHRSISPLLTTTRMLSSLDSARMDGEELSPPSPPKKLHSITVCMVPPPEYETVWKSVSEMRLRLKDPGFYRWPPHANLLYPFLELDNNSDCDTTTIKYIEEIVQQLETATCICPPFTVKLNRFGTFGGKQRGVLWLDPESFSIDHDSSTEKVDCPPLISLQQQLEEAFPSCKDQSQKGSSNTFTPHMTLSHFEHLQDALEAQNLLELPDKPLEFVLDRIYLLERKGDAGQFMRVAQVGLGENNSVTQIFDPPSPFPGMPTEEEEWVHEERMKLKARRNGARGRRGGQRRSRRRSREPRIPDTPEVIAAKRAERKAKRERLEREQNEPEGTDNSQSL